jgi:hypothetical protein
MCSNDAICLIEKTIGLRPKTNTALSPSEVSRNEYLQIIDHQEVVSSTEYEVTVSGFMR